MSLYSDLLRMALEEGQTQAPSLADILSQLRFLRAGLNGRGDPATRIGDTLAYDVALVALCRQFGIQYDRLVESGTERARTEAETILATRLPEFARIVLSDPEAQ